MNNKYGIDVRDYVDELLNLHDNIVIISDGKEILFANDYFLKFTGFTSFDDFKNSHKCVCELFEKTDSEEIIYDGKDGCSWMELLLRKSEEEKKVILKSVEGDTHIFTIKAKLLQPSKERNVYIVTLSDVTQIEDLKMELEEKIELIYNLSTTDALTKTYNRLQFNTFIKEEIATSKRYGEPLSLILYDIDFFKKINDDYGHLVGDSVLVELSDLVKSSIRDSDKLFRFGGEEFIIILSNTALEGAHQAAEHIRKKVEEYQFSAIPGLTCSFGVSQYGEMDSVESFIKRCDDAMYKAKKKHRNRVEIG